MTTIKISQLPDATLPLGGTEVVPLDQSGITKKAAISAINPVINVKTFGAKGDGVTDDTAAIQAAVDYVFSAGGGTLAFPTGTYRVTTIVKVWTSAITINLVGDGKRSTKI
jgi:polygalacturonase